MIGYPSGQDGAILPARDCPFCSRNSISPKSKRVHESLLSENIFRDSKKIFCDLSVRMELENEKTQTRYHFFIYLASFSVLENRQVRGSFFQCSLCHIINLLLTKLVRSRWLDIGLVLFSRFMDLDFVSVHKDAKRELGQYPAILASRLVIDIYIINMRLNIIVISVPAENIYYSRKSGA